MNKSTYIGGACSESIYGGVVWSIESDDHNLESVPVKKLQKCHIGLDHTPFQDHFMGVLNSCHDSASLMSAVFLKHPYLFLRALIWL
jgi:hypothetical protein